MLEFLIVVIALLLVVVIKLLIAQKRQGILIIKLWGYIEALASDSPKDPKLVKIIKEFVNG